MPVQWIYLLQDGTRGYLDEANRFIGDRVPTSDNPIVGRVAFWADDNTCKINVNTASEGVHWDIPRTDTVEDRGLANSQPTEGEYQRHPGHPAMVCLSSVLFPGQRIGTPEGGHGAMEELSLSEAGVLWRIGNGIGVFGGSRGGTTPFSEAYGTGPVPSSYQPYRKFDEILERQDDSDPALEDRVARGGFFLTTRSNAPELTAHDYPRVSVWATDLIPLDIDLPFERIAASRYRFQRTNTGSRHGEFYSRSTNHGLFSYLQSLTVRPVAGYGGVTLGNKYGSDVFSNRDQLLASIFDRIRTSNMGDDDVGVGRNSAFNSREQVSSICLCGGTFTAPEPFWSSRIH